MRISLLLGLALATALLCAGSSQANSRKSSNNRRYSPFASDSSDNSNGQQQMTAPAFQKNTEYSFVYNAQIAAGLIAQDEQSQADPQQKAITRIQCLAKITFGSQRHAQLCLRQIRAGQLNEPVKDEQQCQPMGIFEPKPIPEEKQRQLELCCQFDYAEGVIERVQFQQEDSTWSKNIKRGVLNMLQLNLNQNNAQGLRSGEDDQQQDDQDQEQQQENNNQQVQDTLASSFSIPEITVEGACQTTYTINTAKPSQRCSNPDGLPCSFNVTKAINFKQCSKIADVAFGYQTQQQQPQCAQCQMDWYKQQQKQQQLKQVFGLNGQQQANGEDPCAKCDPKEVKEQKVDRSTVLRYVLKCGKQQKQQEKNCPNCCQLDRTELLSQYVYKNTKSENGPYGAAMHTVVCAQLQLRSVQQQREQVPTQSSDNDETLMFSNQWETDEKRFFMFGDEEYPDAKSSPFHQVPKASQAEQALRKLVQATQNQEQGIEPQQALQLQRLVQMLRMCSQRDLKQVEQNIQQQQQSHQEQEKAKQIFSDALAICGTRNCVKKLAEKIQNQEFSPRKAAMALNSLNNLPAPSDTIVETVEHLCKSRQVQEQPALKQACWLTYGGLVNELCQHKTQKGAQQSVYGAQSGFNQQEQCPANKKEQYKQHILEQFEQAKSTYEKVLALSALGNAGIDSATPKLEQIIKDKREQRVVRVKAIDALRRLRTQQPQRIQQILLPIFQNAREQPEVRTAAFAILMYTQPEQTVMDQLAYSIGQEPNKQVQAFAYRTMKMLANSRSPVDQQISKHIKNALKLANVDEQQLRASGKWQIPMYSQQQQEGLFITLASTISSRSFLPAYAHAQIDSVLNDQFHINDVKLYAMQQEAEQWYEQTAAHFGSSYSSATRGQRRSSDSSAEDYSNNGKSLRDIFTSLGIKSRRSYSAIDFEQQSNGKQQQPFAMFCLRTGDVDRAFIALDEEAQSDAPGSAPIRELLQAVRSGQKPSLARMLANVLQQQQIQTTIATNLGEKQATIPTSVGCPLRMTSSVPVLATIEGTSKIEKQDGALKAQIKCRPMASIVHIQKMECWTPFLVTGVESIRSVEMNIPLHVQLEAGNNQQGLTLKVELPREKTQLFGAHSLPLCYASEVDQKSGGRLVREPRHVRTIQNAKLQRMQHESNMVIGAQSMGIPLHIRSHYHWPGTPTSYQEYFQMLMATDNVFHVKYEPTENSPSQAVFRLSGEHFQATSGQQLQLQDFYANKFEQADSEEQDYTNEFQTESHIQRRQKLQNFLGNFQPRQQYKHSLKISAQTTGGSKEFKGQCELAAHCDSKLQTCQVKIDAHRNQMNDEQQKWMLKAQAQLVMPETVSSVQDIEKLSDKNNKFACQAECQWGADQKQQINIRIQGEQVQRSAWRQLQLGGQQNGKQQQGQQQQQQRLKRRTAFLNKFDVEAQYTGLKPSTQNTFARCLELAKSAYFWNSKSQLVQNERGSQSNGKVLLSMTIDPVTQKHANISVKTPSQLVRLQQIELPVQARPFPLVRQNAQSIQSIGQFISRQEVNSRAECTVDGRSVDTFDDQEYSSPLSTKCFSVLAKDCSGNNNEQPQFAVLMKAASQQCNNKQSCPKKLKVITPEQTVECQQKSGGSSHQIQCKVNGQTVNVDDEDNTVQYNNGQQSDVTVHVRGISVRFNGRKAWLKVSSLYKNQQCGLCGHYDDQADDDEWRMSNNQIASDLGQFHRSYALRDGQECNQEELNAFYEQNGKNIRQRYQQDIDDIDEEEDEDNQQAKNIQAQDWQSERFNGNFDSSDEFGINTNMDDDDEEQYQYDSSKRCGKNNNKNCRRSQQIQPVQKTKVVEQNHEVCFSTQPVNQCPRGTVPAGRPMSEFDDSSSQQDDDDQQDQEDDEQQWKQQKETNVPFVCMNRSSQEARQLLRQFRQGQKVLDVSDHGHSYVEKMRLPQRCRRV